MSGYEEVPSKLEDGKWSSGLCDCFSDCRFSLYLCCNRLLVSLIFHFSRLCVISSIPILHVFSLGQTYTVADKKTGISEEPVCGVVVPLIGKLLNVMKIWQF